MAPLSRYAVTWLTQEQPGGVAVTGPTRAYVRAYDAAGKPVTPPIFLTPTTPGPLLSPSTAGSTPKVAIRDSGEFVVSSMRSSTPRNPNSPITSTFSASP